MLLRKPSTWGLPGWGSPSAGMPSLDAGNFAKVKFCAFAKLKPQQQPFKEVTRLWSAHLHRVLKPWNRRGWQPFRTSGGAAWSRGGACVSPTRVSGCRRRLLLGGTSGLSSSRRGAGHGAGGREQSGHTTRAWPSLEGPEGRGAGQGGTPPGTHPVSRGGAVGGRRLPAPRGPPRAPPTAHLPRPASRAWRPRRSVLRSRARFSAPALRSWRLGAMGECDPADVCSRPAGRLAVRVARRGPRGVGARPAPGRALLEPGGRRPLRPGLAAAALPSPLPPRCGAQASGKKGHQLGGGQTHGQRCTAGNRGRPRPREGNV